MSDASTHQPLPSSGDSDGFRPGGVSMVAEAQGADAGHGRHRGPVSTRDGEVAPHGRHRKPAGGTGTAA
ncbi:hypothetical protein GCM10010129_08440 [Streptomyces fumigatiscleroticus]|nr:hypothetical protein GCM10010129_08440 [Streptomyces fumigatiscleroticus]